MKLLYAKAVLGLVLILTLLCQDVLQTDAKITKNTSKKGKQTILTTSKTHSNSSHAVKASTSSKKKTNSSSSVPMDQITELSQQEAGVWDAHGHSFGQWVFDETTRQLTYTREITVPQAQGLPDALTLIKSTAVSTITPTTAGQFTATISVPVGGEASETQLMETSSSSSASSSASIEGGSEMKQIGRYVKQKEIGRGSFGKVCLYTDPATQESVVVKFALQELVSKDKRGRALNSAAASAATARVAADMENECNFGIKLLSDWPQCSLFMGCDGFFMDSAATTTASSTATATTAAPSPVPGGSSTGGDFYAVLQAGGEVTLLQAMKNKDLSFEQGMVIIYQMFTAVARMAVRI